MTVLSTHVALLAPVPLEHLQSAVDVCAKEGKVAFGSRAFEALDRLRTEAGDAPCDVLIYASDGKASGPPKVTWRARYERFVEAKVGRHPEGMKYRPPTTANYSGDNHGHWYIFWEVSDLWELSDSDQIEISKLNAISSKKKLAKTFIPIGPIIVQAFD